MVALSFSPSYKITIEVIIDAVALLKTVDN